VEMDVRALFESPTLESLAVQIDGARVVAHQQASQNVASAHIPRSGRDCPLSLSYGQEGIWLSEQTGDDDIAASYHNAMCVRLAGDLNVGDLIQALHAIVHRHEALRTRFVAIDGTPLQIIAPKTETPLEVSVLDWSSAAED